MSNLSIGRCRTLLILMPLSKRHSFNLINLMSSLMNVGALFFDWSALMVSFGLRSIASIDRVIVQINRELTIFS